MDAMIAKPKVIKCFITAISVSNHTVEVWAQTDANVATRVERLMALYHNHLSDVFSAISHKLMPTVVPQVGQEFITRLGDDLHFTRVMVTHVDNGSKRALVFAIDFGGAEEWIRFKYLIRNEELLREGGLAKKYYLADIRPKTHDWDLDNVQNCLKPYLYHQFKCEVIKVVDNTECLRIYDSNLKQPLIKNLMRHCDGVLDINTDANVLKDMDSTANNSCDNDSKSPLKLMERDFESNLTSKRSDGYGVKRYYNAVNELIVESDDSKENRYNLHTNPINQITIKSIENQLILTNDSEVKSPQIESKMKPKDAANVSKEKAIDASTLIDDIREQHVVISEPKATSDGPKDRDVVNTESEAIVANDSEVKAQELTDQMKSKDVVKEETIDASNDLREYETQQTSGNEKVGTEPNITTDKVDQIDSNATHFPTDQTLISNESEVTTNYLKEQDISGSESEVSTNHLMDPEVSSESEVSTDQQIDPNVGFETKVTTDKQTHEEAVSIEPKAREGESIEVFGGDSKLTTDPPIDGPVVTTESNATSFNDKSVESQSQQIETKERPEEAEKVEKTDGESTVGHPFVSTQMDVFVTASQTAKSFHFQLSSKFEKISEITDVMTEYYNKIQKTKDCSLDLNTLSVKDVIAVQFSEDNLWYRASILSMDSNKLIVKYIDFGNEETVEASKCKQLTQHFQKIEPQAYECQLVDDIPLQTLKDYERDLTEIIIDCLSVEDNVLKVKIVRVK